MRRNVDEGKEKITWVMISKWGKKSIKNLSLNPLGYYSLTTHNFQITHHRNSSLLLPITLLTHSKTLQDLLFHLDFHQYSDTLIVSIYNIWTNHWKEFTKRGIQVIILHKFVLMIFAMKVYSKKVQSELSKISSG